MKSPRSSVALKSFKDLKKRLAQDAVSLPTGPAVRFARTADFATDPESERRLFLDQVADVRPLRHKIALPAKQVPQVTPANRPENDKETINKLKRLIACGEGFVVSDTPEYMEGRGYQVRPEITMRLHRGEFAIQDHIDLHHLTVRQARDVFDRFLHEAVQTGKRGVLIVHGRGLSSPAEPVLKTKVYQWLTSRRWRRRIIAFASARSCDGGAGATYVLLRRRPQAKGTRRATPDARAN